MVPRADLALDLVVTSACTACGRERDFERTDIERAVTDASAAGQRVAVVELASACACGCRRVRVSASL